MQILEKNLCCGCGACAQSCGKNAIAMAQDANGFLYPQVDESACVDCGLCKKACPVLNNKKQPLGKAYAAMAADELRQESSSGGVFTLLAEHILNMGGVVFGAAFDKKFKLRHIAVEEKAQLPLLRGSKYVQSETGDCYSQAKAALAAGRPVLFTGTPCQINGLRSFLDKDYENLYCQDIICHGVPAPGVWQKYVDYWENLEGSRIKSVNFRHKEKGWKGYQLHIEFKNGQFYGCRAGDDPYMQAFLGDLCLRESCYSCHAKGEGHTADLTLGDFWGVEQLLPDMFDNKGTSLVLVHTDKGQKLLDEISSLLSLRSADIDQALAFNPAMVRSSSRNKNREKFLAAISNRDFPKTVNKYRPKHPIRALKAAIKKLIKN